MSSPPRGSPALRRLGAALRNYVQFYGWRAYALPVLIVITIAAVLPQSNQHPAPARRPVPAGDTGTASRPDHPAQSRAGPPVTTAGSADTPTTLRLGRDNTVCQQTTAARTVVVSISRQHVWMCQAHRQVNDTPATTGATANGDPTPTGSWLISGKERDRYLVGPGYRDYVQYWIPFHGDIGFHDASWQKIPFGSPRYRTDGSHGCVHLPMNEVVWLYEWATIGSTVVTVL